MFECDLLEFELCKYTALSSHFIGDNTKTFVSYKYHGNYTMYRMGHNNVGIITAFGKLTDSVEASFGNGILVYVMCMQNIHD